MPAVIAAFDAMLGDLTELKRGAAVETREFQKAEIAAAVAKQDEVLSQDTHP